MSASHYVMRRDTQKHMPPKPGLHPHPVPPEPPRHTRDEPREGRDFWKEEERRHAPPAAPRREEKPREER